MSAKCLWKILISLPMLNVLVVGVSGSTKKFSHCKLGQSFTHKNTAGRFKMLICTEKINGVPRWEYTDGSSTFGEAFNPARDCSDIVNHLPNAEDGFYWIALKNKTKRKVWCDVYTDGGGFMLVGMKDSPESWTVPSNRIPVHPQGPPHWSSVLGDVKVLDFRVQFSRNKSFEGTKADWMYRLRPKRELGNLFSINNGCPYLQAGIANVSFVKDLMTQTVLNHNFKCSKFGLHVHHMLGWGKMNSCLRKTCNGYARVLFHGVPMIIDKFGSYSYSAVSPFSGMNHNSTAFAGCDNGKCCACFGPRGGKQNYCGPKCTAINGGTVIKHAFVWFWVRTRRPERLWKRCMEFTVKTSPGKHEKHFIHPKTGSVQKGSCSGHLKSFLNEGTLTVYGNKGFEKIPHVPGLLSYRADNKQLYVNEGSQWLALSTKKEFHQLQNQLQSQMEKLTKQYQGILNIIESWHPTTSCSSLLIKRPLTPSGMYYINPRGLSSSPVVQVYCDMTSKNGVGVTVIGHDSESTRYVSGYENAGSYKIKIYYDISMEQIVAITKQSKYCEQFIKYECHDSQLLLVPDGWWVSRQGLQMNYWGGAAANSGKCACGMTNSCAGGGICNCDKNDRVLREDSGYLTDKNTLPVSELRFGDTGPAHEYGYHTLGKLRCWG